MPTELAKCAVVQRTKTLDTGGRFQELLAQQINSLRPSGSQTSLAGMLRAVLQPDSKNSGTLVVFDAPEPGIEPLDGTLPEDPKDSEVDVEDDDTSSINSDFEEPSGYIYSEHARGRRDSRECLKPGAKWAAADADPSSSISSVGATSTNTIKASASSSGEHLIAKPKSATPPAKESPFREHTPAKESLFHEHEISLKELWKSAPKPSDGKMRNMSWPAVDEVVPFAKSNTMDLPDLRSFWRRR
jgi:hypothetical protein